MKANLTKVGVKRCAKCNVVPGANGINRINRHHKGNDRVLSRYSVKILVEYSAYKDCVFLCDRCHAIIHIIYFLHVDWSIKPIKRLRREFILVCDSWLKGRVDYIPSEEMLVYYHAVQSKLSILHETYKGGVFNGVQNSVNS